MKNVACITLGCDKNRVDTEMILARVANAGYNVSEIHEADAIIINTCAFIESARREAIETVLQCDYDYKKNGSCQFIILCGCLAQKHKDEIVTDMPEVDAVLKIDEYDKIGETLDRLFGTKNTDLRDITRILTTYPHLAYLKIADGCENKCTFCTIPSIRGAYRSVDMQSLVEQTQSLASDGVSEIILVAQDVTRYGIDLYGKPSLCELIRQLCKTDIAKIRLLYCYPEMVTDELIDLIVNNDKLSKYIDVPIQHINDGILKTMNRKSKSGDIRALFEKLHANNIVIRTTLMVGFPNETQENFTELKDFIAECKPQYSGIFAYSKEEGTPAAKLKNQVPVSIKKKRVDELGAVATAVTFEFNKSLVGSVLPVRYEDIDDNGTCFVGRADFQAPDVDGKVIFTSKFFVDVGKIYNVKITDCDEYDLYGETVE